MTTAEDLDIDTLKASPIADDLERVLSLLPAGVLGRSNSWRRRSSVGVLPVQGSPAISSSISKLPESEEIRSAVVAEPHFKDGSVILSSAGDIHIDSGNPQQSSPPSSAQQSPPAANGAKPMQRTAPTRVKVAPVSAAAPSPAPAPQPTPPAQSAAENRATEAAPRRVQPQEVIV